ncbi:general transcription factor 3C polypeptide 5-like isoform X2 [Abrus precatorius]|uniref:General transcription factor 3C polypeptide 5-like isoform X2 n=1 Tax=Abrus precatorius TaxID=3816 RepID=A0A8B8LWS1_ABRPR|nr:general transcription factor 3C polypeptide 5-like isoform X2 [Abrus precatorius]
MGVIKDGTISGVIPEAEGFLVHYPAYPSSISRAIHTLGGIQSILKTRTSQANKLELRFRPEDPYSHPAFGELRPSNSLLLKISKTKPPRASHTSPQNGEHHLCADIVARVPEAYFFDGMADYQHVIPVHADIARRKKRNWSELEEPHFDKGGLMDLDHEDVMIIVPPIFAPKDVPENLVLRPPTVLGSKKKQEEVVQHVEVDTEPVLAIDFDIKEIPKKVNWEEYVPQGSEQWESQMVVSRMFDERPIWSKDSLTERLLDKGLTFSHGMLRRLLSRISYYFSSGPFLRFWIKKGYDPRKDPDSRIYQRIDYRVPVPLRSYCDAHSANKSTHRWEDICAFRAFPYKFQTSLQLFELVDDYIQSEINKPPSQATCTFGTGWFSQHMINCIRQRLMVRFLSVFPKPGAENLLRAATSRFEKLKKECGRNVTKLDGEECQQANSGLEENEEPDNAEDEEEAAEGNDSDEEWEEELDLISTWRIFQGLIYRSFLVAFPLMKLMVTKGKQMVVTKNIIYTRTIVTTTLMNDC